MIEAGSARGVTAQDDASPGRILVVGSANVDLVLEVPRHPLPGETLSSTRIRRSPGGKGANQACAAARLGGRVRFVGRTGADDDAELALSLLGEADVELDDVTAVEGVDTGLAVVTLDSAGENSIVLAPGANATWTPQLVGALADAVASSDVVIAQGEIPAEAVDEVARLCIRTGTRLVLNLAPVIDVARSTLMSADPLVVNEHEGRLVLEMLTSGDSPQDDALVVHELRRAGVPSVIMTRGAEGAIVSSSDIEPGDEEIAGGAVLDEVSSPSVSAVDTTGAGDAFVGALGVAISRGEALLAASDFAARVGAFAVTRHGAQAAYPWSRDPLPR